jgi:hypothetical protein
MCYLMCYRKYVCNESECTLNRQYLIFVLMCHLILHLKYVQNEVNRNDAFYVSCYLILCLKSMLI